MLCSTTYLYFNHTYFKRAGKELHLISCHGYRSLVALAPALMRVSVFTRSARKGHYFFLWAEVYLHPQSQHVFSPPWSPLAVAIEHI